MELLPPQSRRKGGALPILPSFPQWQQLHCTARCRNESGCGRRSQTSVALQLDHYTLAPRTYDGACATHIVTHGEASRCDYSCCHAAAPCSRGDVQAAALATAPEGPVLRAVPAGRGGGAADAALPVRQVRYPRAHVDAPDQDVTDPQAQQRRVLAGQGHAAGRAPRRRPHPVGVRRGSGRPERHVRRDLGAQGRVRGRGAHGLRPPRRHPSQGQAHVRHGEPRVLLVGPAAARPVHPRVRRHGRGHVGGHLLVRGADARASGGRPGERAGAARLRRGGQPRVLLRGSAGAHEAHVLRRLRAAQVALPAATKVRERPRRRRPRAGAASASRRGAVPVDPVWRERVDEPRDQGLEGRGVRLLDESTAIYGAPGAAERRAGGSGLVLPPQVLRQQLQAAETLARAQRHRLQCKKTEAGQARYARDSESRSEWLTWRARSSGTLDCSGQTPSATMDLISASLPARKCRGPGIAGDLRCCAVGAWRPSVVARRQRQGTSGSSSTTSDAESSKRCTIVECIAREPSKLSPRLFFYF